MGDTVVRVDGDGTDFGNLDDGVEEEEGVEDAREDSATELSSSCRKERTQGR